MSILMNPINEGQSPFLLIIDEHFQLISIYLLWSSNIDEEFKIQAIFGKNLKYDFEPIDRYQTENRLETVIYRLEHHMQIFDNDTNNNIINKYQLRISTKSNLSGNYDDLKERTINIHEPYQFLFDVNFHSHPSISKRRTDDFWNQLCFYIYFLIKNNMYEKFNCIIEQFKHELGADNTRKLTQHLLNSFFHTCSTYLPQINSYLKQNQNAVKIFLQMFGLLPIDKDNFKYDNKSLNSLASEFYEYIKIHLNHLLQTINNQDEWILLTRGLIIFMSAQILGNQTTFNTFILLEQMKDYRDKQDLIVNFLLQQLIKLQVSIKNNTWIKLFSLTTDINILINCLEVVISFDDYLIALQYVIKHNRISEPMKLRLMDNFDRLINRPAFILSLDNILSLLKYLQSQSNTTNLSSTENTEIFQLIIKSSHLLHKTINTCLDDLDINQISLESLCELFQLDHSVSILNINKTNYLIKILTNYKNRTAIFYITWFNYFLCDKYYQNNADDQENFQKLLKIWLDHIKNDFDMLSQIIANLDLLFDHLQNIIVNDNRLDKFREDILTICFQSNLIFRILLIICTKINNKEFLDIYEKIFIKDLLDNNRNKLKLMEDPTNPLYQLLDISKTVDPTNSRLLSNLITECTKLIELNNEEIRYETFIHPSKKTFTYTVLFDKHLNDYNLFIGTINQLDSIWFRWTHTGLTLSDIQIWKRYSSDERNTFEKIWKKIQQHFKKQQDIDTIFRAAQLEYSEKKILNEAMIITLNLYCDKATDYSYTINSLRDMSLELNDKSIRSVTTPTNLKNIEDIASKLQPFSESKVWLNYYNRSFLKIEKRGSHSSTSSKQLINLESIDSDSDDENWTSQRSSSTSSAVENSRLTRSRKESLQPKFSRDNLNSVEILVTVNKIFEDFRLNLIRICNDWKKEPVYEWLQLFSDDQDISCEIEILKTNLNLTISKELIDILTLYDKRNLIFIRHVCQGLINLAIRLDISIKDNDYTVLKTLVKLDENILGDKCLYVYETYLNQYVSPYTTNTLVVWSQYSIACELIDFVNGISSSDFENLLENVYDWDDKLVGAKTVRDYQILKHYFEQVYKSINELRQDKKRFLLPNILSCFNNIDISNQISNIEELFSTCSTELPQMRQSHSELTDKEQTKRRLIINIMHKSLIKFIQLDKFDILLSPHNMNFSDLSELRDRARLIEYSYRNKMKKDDEYQIEQFEYFITFVNIIETILNTLILLYIAGHPIISEIILHQNKEFQCDKDQFNDLINFNETLQEVRRNWEKTLIEKYILYPELTYFSCKQFDMIEQFIYHQSQCDQEEYGYHLLKYIGLNPTLTRRLDQIDQIKHVADERLEEFGKILSAQRCPQHILSQKNRTDTKIYLIETSDDGVLKAILSLYERFHSTPNVNHLFYCTNETNWMEIRGFLYRCMYSQEFHQLIRPELLSLTIQDQMINLIRQFIGENSQESFSFGIITTISTGNLQLTDGLKSLQIVQTIHEQDLMNDTDFLRTTSNLIKQCTIVISRITGLGKTHTIREECSRLNKKYIKFPINGDVQADLLAKRLLKEARHFHNGAIHFDIGVIDNDKQINDLINCLILFRSFCFGQIAISIPEETPIYIELDCSPHSNLWEHIILFNHIPRIFIDHINWQKLIPNRKVLFVVNYLKAIKDKTITTNDITLNEIKPIKVDECVKLIQEYFFNKHNKYITWTKVFICISIFYRLFLGFSQCMFFTSHNLQNAQLRKSRMDILQAFLNSAKQFTSSSVETVRTKRSTGNNHIQNDHHQQQELSNAIIRWNEMEPFILIFSSTYEPIFVYKTEKDIPPTLKNYFDLYNQKFDFRSASQKKFFSPKPVKTLFPDYKQLSHEELFGKLAKLADKKYLNQAICTKCFRQYEYNTLVCENCRDVLDILDKPYPSFSERDITAFQNRIAKIIESEYVITADNFIKMLLVYLRVESGVPVLIMGETGCGKTALINCLSQKILNDDVHVFRLHAGITNEKLLEEMNKLIIQAETLPSDKRLWVFFDEFNTIFNISLLKEIICERTLLGKDLPKNMVFLGTCNPRREASEKAVFNENVGIPKDRYDTLKLKLKHNQPNLIYTVTPIPETMLEYIWDYGHLDLETEKKYIEATLKTCEGLTNNMELFRIVTDLISESQEFLRALEDKSSVSLRDVARFRHLYKWFTKYLVNSSVPSKLTSDSSRLALLLCYYFRLDTKDKKSEYLARLDKYLCFAYGKPRLTYVRSFERLLERERKRLIDKLQIPSDMAHNRALTDNLFVLFSCIINHIPVFLCGKPGASKTSAVQILMNNLKGLRSDRPEFRQLPELVAINFQGSQNCTSKSIEQVFQRVKKLLKVENNSGVLPVIIFDEIGLAESSPHNPLKVLHEHLEIEECQFGFVGISNYRLDASKMNRALYIACLDPDEQDLKSTGVFLSHMNSNSNQDNQFDSNIILGLAQAYFDLRNQMSKEHNNENYFGLRDYYSLIKGIVHDHEKYPKRSQFEIIYQQLIINFGGTNNGYDYMWEKFCTLIDRHDLKNAFQMPTPKELIEKCLTNRNGRNLMLIVDRESTSDHVERYITKNPILNGSVKTLVGSQFEGDFVSNGTYTESYSTRVLMEIILHAETPITLVIRGMTHLYDNLYDLFNQNFAISGRKKYCRIALSAIYNPRCLVHDQFYCVILLNGRDVAHSAPPLLNRFQKHFIQVDKLTEQRQWSLTCQLLNWLTNLPIPNVNKQFLLLKNLIISYSPDYICDLVIDICQDNDFTNEMIINSCKQKLMRACSYDFALVLSLSGNEDLIEQYYNIHYNLFNISQLISSTFEQTFPTKRIIYTYTHIYDTIDYENSEQIHEIKLSIINTELDLINRLQSYIQKKNYSHILIIRIDHHRENQHILSLKYNILNQWNELKDFHLWIIFHVQRNKLYEIKNDVLFNGWDVIMIDDLNNKNKFIPKEILINPSYEYFINNFQYKFLEIFFDEFIHRNLTKFRSEILSSEEHSQRYILLLNIINHEENQYLRQIFLDTIQYLIKTISNPDENLFKDWRYDLISNQYISLTSRSYNEALQSVISLFYDSYFRLLIYHFEIFNLIDSYFYLRENQSIDLKNLWNDCYKLSLKTIDNSMMNIKSIEVNLSIELKLPYSNKENQNLKKLREILQTTVEEDEKDIESFIIKLLKETSSYGGHLIDYILNNNQLLDLYYHDQLILFHIENKFQLSTKFILKLLTTNTKQSTMNRLIQLISNPDELEDILHIFEDGFKLFNEDTFLKIMDQQLITIQSFNQVPNSFYSIFYRDEKFHLIPPNTLEIDENFESDSLPDPFIEISLLNLIESIISPTFICQIGDLEQITAIFSSINQRLLKLCQYIAKNREESCQYEVKNREKLCSYMALLRCIRTLNPTQALEIFQRSCRDLKFNALFETCNDIHQFIQNLEIYVNQQRGCEFDRTDVRKILLKLEVEFLKNWFVDHNNQYSEIFKLINQTDSLWKYSAKIFSHIVGQLDLLEDIEISYKPSNDQAEKITELDEHLNSFEQSQYKLHRLLVDRIHLDLILRDPIDNSSIKKYLNVTNSFENFEKNVQYVTSYLITPLKERSDMQLILVLSWLKYYAQLYSFALVKNIRFQYLTNIDHYLTNNKSSFCSTLKLFIVKQMMNILKMDLNTFQTNITDRNITWLHEFFTTFNQSENRNERNLFLPIPLLELEHQYIEVNQILSNYTDDNAVENLISLSSKNQYLCYCFYVWFIKYYVQYSNKNFQPNDHYRNLFQRKLSDQSKMFLQPVGIQFLHKLSINFSIGSYFRLNSSMSDRDIAIRLIILNIFALTLSFKSFPHANWINTILFDTNSRMPTNYFEYLESLCLFGLLDINPIVSNMKYVRESIKQRLNSGRLSAAGKYIYQCSKDCFYIYDFTHSGIPNSKGQCLFCKKDIGLFKHGALIQRNPPQIQMTIEEGLKFIDEYIETFNRINKFGYHKVLSPDQSNLEQRPYYLKNSISFRFLHLFLHSILILLKEFEYLSNPDLDLWDIDSDSYFQKHIEKDYELLEKCIPDSQYCYVWIFQLLNSMSNSFEQPLGCLDSKEKVIQIEKIIEQKLIIPHCASKMDDINNYKKAFSKFTKQEEMDNTLISYLDERTENDRRYPFLNFFNVTQIDNQNRIEGFFDHLKIMSHAQTNYPLTMYILEHIDVLNNIQHLYDIIQFINYLRDKYNYRISRQQAITKSIQECLNEKGYELFKKFCNAWSKINLSEVRYGCQLRTFDRNMDRDKKLAFFSLNISKDDSSLILAAVLQTIVKLQNNIVNYFHHDIIQSATIRRLPIHMIEKEHLLNLDREFINNKILTHALVINYEYGQSKDIIYDYEEIEITLRSLVNRLPLINIDKFRKIQYQLELYSENNALINDVRHYVAQKQIDNNLRKQYQGMLRNKDDNDLLQYLGSLDNVFTYIQNRNYNSNISTIKLFVNQFIRSKSFLESNAFLTSSFASIRLEYIIDLYELIEEIAFDKIFRNHIEDKLNDQLIDKNQRKYLQDKFLSLTIDNKKIAISLRNAYQWIGTLKRFMVRILPDYVDLNIPIEVYLKRTDLWNGQITEEDIQTIHLDDDILLKHTFIILLGLENRLNQTNDDEHQTTTTTTTNQNLVNQNDVTTLFGPSSSQKTIKRKGGRYRNS